MASIIKPPYFASLVNEGEKKLLNYLEVGLPDDYYLIPSLEIASTNPRNGLTRYWEYDLIVIAPHGIFNIENKDWRGRIEGDDNYWYLNDHQRPNPHKTNRLKSTILASDLKNQNFEWGRAWVQGVVTLSYDNYYLPVISSEAQKLTFQLDKRLLDYLTNPSSIGKEENSIAHIQMDIVNYLRGQQSKKSPTQKREVLEYEILKVLEQGESYTEYLVKPKGTSTIQRRVKEYALQVTGLSRDELKSREDKIKNQYNALNKLRSKNFILNVEFRVDNENHLFYEIFDYLEESTLRAEARVKTFTYKEKMHFIDNIMVALEEAHKESIFHRDINPENIYLINGYAYLGNFGKSYFVDHSSEGYTVMPTLNEMNATAYHPLELTVGDAMATSDIYSLGVLIYWLFVGKEPFRSPYELNNMGGKLPKEIWPSSINQNLPNWVDEICLNTILIDETLRIGTIEEVREIISKNILEDSAQHKIDAVKSKKDPTKLILYEDFKEGDSFGDYIIHEVIGKGGYSIVFKVEHRLQRKFYALKLFNQSVNFSAVKDEYEALSQLNHQNIVKFKWNGTIENGQFYTVMELLEGPDISDYTRTDQRLPIHQVYELAKDILSALVLMQSKTKPLLHRDIKPQNIIWDKNKRFVLLDFNVASSDEKDKNFVGTNPYLAPDLIMPDYKINWNLSADTFALGVTLFELICKQYPWAPSKMPVGGKEPNNPKEIEPKISKEFSDFLLKAIGFKSKTRFQNAKEMLEALLAFENNIYEEDTTQDGLIHHDNHLYRTKVIFYQSTFTATIHESMKVYADLHNTIEDVLKGFKSKIQNYRTSLNLEKPIGLKLWIDDKIIIDDDFWKGGAKRLTAGVVDKLYDELKDLFDKNKSKIRGHKIDIEGINIVDYINSLYSQSKHGNFGTRVNHRGEKFDDLTYTNTKLDKKLIPAIMDGRFKLLIITGNAGDGKTAFIKKIEKDPSVKNLIQFEHSNGSSFTINDVVYESNYDGSQDEEEKANDEVLDRFFFPFVGLNNYNKAEEGRIIAINEGRLVEFLNTSSKYKHLAKTIEDYFYEGGHTKLPDGLMIVNLNLRSVVAAEEGSESLFKQQVKALTRKELWENTENIGLPADSFIRYNVETLNDSAAGETIINKLEWLLRTVSFKRELHITMRDIRSFIAFLITRDTSIEDLPEIEKLKETNPEKYWQYFYFNITNPKAKDSGNNDRLIKLLRETDIGEVSIPSWDRELFFSKHQESDFLEFAERKVHLIQAFNSNKEVLTAQDQTPEILRELQEKHKAFVRHHFFEAKGYWEKNNGRSENGNIDKKEPLKPSYLYRFPYKSIFEFVNILEEQDVDQKVIETISKAVSMNEGSKNENLAKQYLVLASTETKDYKGYSYKLFPLSEFELIVSNTEHLTRYLEYEPDSLIFRHKKDTNIQLTISLDLYEMLFFIKKGFSPSLNDLKGKFVELTIFKNLLQNLNYDEVVVTPDNRTFYNIQKTNTNITIQKMTV